MCWPVKAQVYRLLQSIHESLSMNLAEKSIALTDRQTEDVLGCGQREPKASCVVANFLQSQNEQ